MPATYNDLYLDARKALKGAGVEAAQLEAREIIKCKVLENSMLTAREACEQLAKLTRSEEVQVIGTKFVLYRQHYDKGKRKIELVKDRPRKPPVK